MPGPRTLVLGSLAALMALTAAIRLQAQEPTKKPETDNKPATLRVLVPANAQVEIDGKATTQTGEVRRFVSPPLEPGKSYKYTIKASWVTAGQVFQFIREADITADKETVLDFRNFKDETVRVIFVPTPQEVVDKMLEMAGVKKDDVVYDLGCGDGRIVVTAAKKFGARGVGVDLDPERIKDSQENVKKNGVEKLVEIRQGDALKVKDIGKASVVTLYMLPEFNRRLVPILKKELKPGSRIVSHDYRLGDWEPEKHVTIQGPEREHTLYYWKIGEDTKKPPE
jgi:uncharacterized protein (TIGR03000 family)